ncbi:AAA family ATPase [Psychromonas sp. SP041]|uniref:ATP-dependent nuclease n=1 Tax=Psychromonas sp. SP041 TaxID=1365007 RepID=UPI00040817FD|nr:AAA family ATPase [Psychromonas sp. SP041]
MKLRISYINLKNFKTFAEISIHPNPDFNIIIGENSSGKSTVFEAIHLWEKCYQTYILGSRKGFYKVKKSTNRYVNYQDLDFLRITKDEDLFHNPKDPELGKCSEITIALTNDEEEAQTWNLGFKVTCPSSIENAFYRVQPTDEEQFTAFAEAFCGAGKFLDEAIFIYQTRPVAGVHQFEPYYNEAQIKKKIQKGSSHEVLRNKIISKRKSISDLEASISEIVEKEVKFTLPPTTRREKDEYVRLDVSVNGSKPYDLHLQGSGFLQIVEILATVEFIDAPLKLLLVDEPDSHIHSKLQQNLLNHLRKIDHNQFFVISHNDQFVTNAGEGEVFFLSDDAKHSGSLEPIDITGFDAIKNALGGVILSLELLNQAKHIAFVEGSDDASYLHLINRKIKEIHPVQGCLSEVTFFPLRGKDNIVKKIEYNKRTLSSLIKGKSWNAIFDRDFSTAAIDESLKNIIIGKKCTPHSHEGYCIESVIFSDITIFKRYICSLIDFLPDAETEIHIVDLLQQLSADIRNPDSPLNKSVEERFNGQKNNRPEFENLQFVEVMRSWSDDGQFKPERVMSKPLIRDFVIQLESKIKQSLFIRTSNKDEEVASILFNKYIEFIASIDDLVPSLKQLFTQLGVLAVPDNEANAEGQGA